MPAPEVLRFPGQADLFALHAAQPLAWPYLLESRQLNPRIGRYSLLLGECGERLVCRDPARLDEMLAALPAPRTDMGEPHLPFAGGWFLYLAYEAALGLQPHLAAGAAMPAGHSPPALAVYCGAALIVDHAEDCTWVVSESGQGGAHRRALQQARPAPAGDVRMDFAAEAPEDFRAVVRQAVDYILAGDIYQANLSRRWQGRALPAARMLDAYARLRRANPACFAASVQDPDLCLASASPERLFLLDDGQIETRPIAGTRPRGDSPTADRALIEELLQHPKEQAEHIMLVDLERNDLGRVCAAHSVHVSELLALESYATVHHIVSNVCGRLRPGTGLKALLQALFPGGTITGCPKIRCMQIIGALERRWRGAYTGSLGYISNTGRMDFNILIRTLAHENGQAHFDAGAGIVADSDPQRELAETEAKAAGLMQALA